MKGKNSLAAGMILLAVLANSCTVTYDEPEVSGIAYNGPRLMQFIKPESIEEAGKIRKKMEDEEVYCKDNEIMIEFFMLESSGGKKKKVKAKVKEKNNDRDDRKKKVKEKDDDKDKDKKELMTTPVKARFTQYGKIISLRDLNRYTDAVFYNEQQKVNRIICTYNEEKEDWFYPNLVDQSMEGDGIFYSDGRYKWFSANMPTMGTELSYCYEVDYENIKYLTKIFFHESYAQKKKTITIAIPDWLDADVIALNTEGFDITRSETKPKKMRIDEVKKIGREDEDVKKGKGNVRYITFEAKNLAAWKNEPFAAGPTYNMPHLLVVAKTYREKQDTVDRPLLKDVNDLYRWCRSLVNAVDNDTAKIRAKALEITAGKTTDQEKIEAVYYWVQENVRYIAFEDGIAAFKPEACQNVLENRYGDCKGMANLTTQMLRTLGYDARLTWIGTRHIAYDYSMPTIAVANHMISSVTLDGQRYFLDPTETYNTFGDYAHRIQGKQVLIEESDTSFIIDSIPDLSYERNKLDKTEKFILKDLSLSGTAKEVYRGESKVGLLQAFFTTKSDRKATAIERFLSNDDINLQVSNIRHTSLSERKSDIVFDYDVQVANHVIRDGKDLFINLEWDYDMRVKLDTGRLTDFEVSRKIYNTKVTEVELPPGARVKHLPAPLKVNHPYYILDFRYEMVNGKLYYHKSLILPQGKIPKKHHAEWREVRTRLVEFYNDHAIITTN